MTAPALTIPISYGYQVKKRPRVNALQLGDGYEQRAPLGINPVKRTYSVTFGQRTIAEADEIDAFFDALGGVDYFTWTPHVGAAGKWKCSEWDRTGQKGENQTIVCTFEEVFEP